MIEIIGRDPIFKRIISIFLISFVVICAIQISLEFYQINNLHSQNIGLTQELVGKLVKLYPQEEIDIVKGVLGENSKEDRRFGKEILSKYGYDINTKIYDDPVFKGQFYSSITKLALALSLILLVNLLLLINWTRTFTMKIKKFSEAVEAIMEGDFHVDMDQNAEGIFSRLASQFNQMARRLDMSLKNLNREKENIKSLVTDISHQLKTPLSSIKLFNTLLGEELSAGERAEFLERSNLEVHKLQWLVGDLIKISRLEAGMIELRKEKANIKDAILKAVSGVYLKAEEKDIDINLEDMNDHIIEHDSRWTQEALFNVLENAVKYTGAGGQIKVSMVDMDMYIKIEIEDNGIGIPKEEYNNIFKRFYRGSSKEVQNTQGSGIGLYLTRKILEEQGGSIMVESFENGGTKFMLFLQKCKHDRKGVVSFV